MQHKSTSTKQSTTSRSSSSASTMSNFGETVKEHPFATAAAAAGTIAAGAFLWSKRSQISDQASRMSNKMPGMNARGSSSRELAMTDGPNESAAIEASRATAKSTSNGGRVGSAGQATTGQSTTAGQNMNAGRAGAQGVSY